ncbi:MAG TPA: DUF2786 domain-containing protein [Nocardioidaceae bacterium]|nr:DUF2786 domain-containing protein [Nocardioidaceae bacterium]
MTEQILAKVRKILAKAEDPAATQQEAETYTAKAAALIAEYGIDRALLAQTDPESDIVGDRVVVLDPPYALDKSSLLSTVAIRLRCRAVHRSRYLDGAKQISVHLFGYESDLLRSELLYTSLLLQATSTLTRTPVPRGESAAAFRRSWLAGFTAAIGRRLVDAEQRAERQADRVAEPGTPSVALVLADRSVAVRDAVDKEYPRLGRAQSRRLSGSGGMAGWQAGQRADLGGGSRLGGRPRGRLAG